MLIFKLLLRQMLAKNTLPFLLLLLVFASSCSITRNVPEGNYLLDNADIIIKSETKKPEVKEGELSRYVRQKPNKRILLFRFHLRLFNMANPNKDKGISRLLRTIGEEPVLLDTFQTSQSTANLLRYMQSKGFYGARVADTTQLGRKSATVQYVIHPGSPHRIRSISYLIEDTLIRRLVLTDTVNRIVQRGDRFDIDLLREERKRIERNLREEGYFFFSRDFITFSADTSVNDKKVDLELVIRNRFTRNAFGERIPQKYRKYEISNVYVYTNYDPVEFFYLQEEKLLDTMMLDNQHFIYSYKPNIKFRTVSNANLLRPGQIYSESITQKTRDNLNSLRLFRAVNVFFRPDEASDKSTPNEDFIIFNADSRSDSITFGKLNCFIQLTPHTLQSYQVDFGFTNTSSDIGAEGNINYQHKNIFKGAEVLDTKLRGMVQFLTGERFSASSIEFGGSVGLSFPRFLSPFAGQEFVNRYSPRTQVVSSYSFQQRPEYTRTLAGMNFSYIWRSENNFTHTFTPAEVSVINIFQISDVFWDKIKNTYEANSYRNQFVTLTGYGFIYSTQSAAKKSYSVLRYNAEISGNVLRGLFSALDVEQVNGAYQLFNTNFSQYARNDINYVYNQVVDENNTFVYRLYAGVGLPYGNSAALPFEKKYFSGGSSGVRAWPARGLGPGSYIETQLKFPNQTADIKLEANLEYRFKLVWLLEGALFLDAGNVWAISSADDRPGSVFTPKSFYKQIALGTGTGLRMNLGFFTLRFDVGVKVYDPGIYTITSDNVVVVENKHHWIPFDRPYSRELKDFAIHFGIGYPF